MHLNHGLSKGCTQRVARHELMKHGSPSENVVRGQHYTILHLFRCTIVYWQLSAYFEIIITDTFLKDFARHQAKILAAVAYQSFPSMQTFASELTRHNLVINHVRTVEANVFFQPLSEDLRAADHQSYDTLPVEL